MATLADALLALARKLVPVYEGVTTSAGTTATLVDTTISGEADDYFNGGTVFFLEGTLAGITASVTDFVASTGTVTFSTQAAAPGSGKRWAAAPGDWSRGVLREMLNAALANMPLIKTDSSLTTVANQVSYSLPTGIRNIRRVEVAFQSSQPYWFAPHMQWREVGSSLVFFEGCQPEEGGFTMRLTYEGAAAALAADADLVDASINLERLSWAAAVEALRWKVQRHEAGEAWRGGLLQEAMARSAEMEQRYPTPHLARDVKFAGWG
jgi:hypothetical protein